MLVEILNVRQAAECLVLDGASLSVTALQQVGAIDLVLVLASRGDNAGGSCPSSHGRNLQTECSLKP